ncbi:hypothetical protein D3C85_1401550 [compost metagenome]
MREDMAGSLGGKVTVWNYNANGSSIGRSSSNSFVVLFFGVDFLPAVAGFELALSSGISSNSSCVTFLDGISLAPRAFLSA